MPSDFTPEQQRLEELAERCLAEAENAMETNEGFLFAAISGAKDYADAQVRLLECWPKLSSDVLADVLHRGLVAAECWGRLTVENEAAEAHRGASRSAPTTQTAKTADFAAADPTEIRLEPLVMKEALEFWKTKMLLGDADFKRLDDRAKVRAFAVAGLAKGRELEQVYQALTRAIAKGTPLADFQSECADIFEKRGWTGKNAWRVDNIFRTNIQTAYNVGRYKQQKEQAKFFPYLRYSAVNDSRTRPVHRAMDGLIYPIDHPFWDTWYPPNGFQCRCGTRSLTKGQVERLGLAVETEDPTGSEREVDVKVIDKATGKIGIVKKSVKLDPDPGWGYHPGKSMWGGLLKKGEKSGEYRDMPLPVPKQQYDPLQKVQKEKLRWFPEEDVLESGLADSVYITAFQAKYGGDSKMVKDPLGDMVLLSLRAFQADKSKKAEEDLKTDKPGHGEVVPLLEEMAMKPFEIWLVPQVNEVGRVRLVKRYIGLWRVDDQGKIKVGAFAEFETVDGILQGVTAFAPTTRSGASNLEYLDRQRTGVRLYPPKRDRSKEKR